MSEQKNDTNYGCAVFIAICVIVNLVIIFNNEKEEIIETGEFILALVAIGIGYFVFKFISSNKEKTESQTEKRTESKPTQKTESKSVLKYVISGVVGLIVTGTLIKIMSSSEGLQYTMGAIFIVVVVIALGIFAYFNIK